MTPNTTNKNLVHAVENRFDSCLKATFCGIANLRKRKYLILSTDWDRDRVTCPECLNSPAYRERIAKKMADRMNENKKWYDGIGKWKSNG